MAVAIPARIFYGMVKDPLGRLLVELRFLGSNFDEELPDHGQDSQARWWWRRCRSPRRSQDRVIPTGVAHAARVRPRFVWHDWVCVTWASRH